MQIFQENSNHLWLLLNDTIYSVDKTKKIKNAINTYWWNFKKKLKNNLNIAAKNQILIFLSCKFCYRAELIGNLNAERNIED